MLLVKVQQPADPRDNSVTLELVNLTPADMDLLPALVGAEVKVVYVGDAYGVPEGIS